MEDQAAVNNGVESTTQSASAPVQDQNVHDQYPPAGESAQHDQRTSPSVPYERFKEVNDRVKQLEDRLQTIAPRQVPQPVVPQNEALFDNETVQGIRSVFKAELEQERAVTFARTHREELADPLLRGATLIEIQEANARGEYMDQETALANAKKALETRLAPKVEAAATESFNEGKNLARRKEQAGAVGGTNAASLPVDPDTLNAEDYAAYMGLNRV